MKWVGLWTTINRVSCKKPFILTSLSLSSLPSSLKLSLLSLPSLILCHEFAGEGGVVGGGRRGGRPPQVAAPPLQPLPFIIFVLLSTCFSCLYPILHSKFPNTNPDSLDLKKEKEKGSYLLLSLESGSATVLGCVVIALFMRRAVSLLFRSLLIDS